MQDYIAQLHQVSEQAADRAQTVLVVDDDAAIREMVTQLLEEAGYETLEAADGVEGLEVARAEQPDVIILDVMMPRLNGFDCAAALKGDPHCRRIPIMMLTVIDQAQRAFGLGVEAYLTKPFDDQKVISEVGRLLNKRVEPRRVVVLGQKEDSRAVLEQLQKTAANTTHIEDFSGLESALAAHGPDVALVVGSDFQETTERLRIQQMVGSRPCLVLYINPDSGLPTDLNTHHSVGVDNV